MNTRERPTIISLQGHGLRHSVGRLTATRQISWVARRWLDCRLRCLGNVFLIYQGNDDILWWAFGALTAAELYGQDAKMGTEQTFLKLATNSHDAVWQQWDTAACGGGIYWSRDRSSSNLNHRNYKSTITYKESNKEMHNTFSTLRGCIRLPAQKCTWIALVKSMRG